ncbi:serine hydrolase domain-containing protein [Flavobacterium granuli]|uniref:CubicO group peptidase (Beta-lactamase class C family) n=1 Tax=Flavobacterium granuli TaxID=280093 RepID=A0A1M5LG00_9FLAO|nr:serine hydrolase [Flavobacterium granuli]PRZ23969.1 CubicO group peptidase (beta-lactamase class C family) [Flavobacterium granuli]SHG64054.1 CubicO group peptidase, beta-lactamase class C family [Flavobacterium granuli]
MPKTIYNLLILLLFASCNSETKIPTTNTDSYFPPLTGTNWETKSIADLNWKQSAVQPLLDYLQIKNTKSFMILVNGRIVMENYFNGHTANTNWYWASAGKTLTATLTGIAEQEGFINLDTKVSTYLGNNWTSLALNKENLITAKHLLTMTSGLEDLDNGDCVTADCLTYKADAGTRWAYHNVYVKLQDIIAQATNQTWTNYFNARLRDKIGMDGNWITVDNNSVYTSTTRSMARFGLLILNKGKWDNNIILNENYCNTATTTSQNINSGYGYLWWINGKSSYHLPQSQLQFSGSIIPSAPNDMFMALGKNDQKIYVVPSKNMVIIRMGNAADNSNLALSDFDAVLWQKIRALYQ